MNRSPGFRLALTLIGIRKRGGRRVPTQLEGKVQRWKQDIDKKQKEIDLMSLNLSNERVLLTKELIDEREEEIKIKESITN